MTKVVHCRKEKFDVYIGRPSKWANPFLIGKDGTRYQVLRKYEKWILKQSDLLRSLGELENKILGCWCIPNMCHGHILIKLIKRRKDVTT